MSWPKTTCFEPTWGAGQAICRHDLTASTRPWSGRRAQGQKGTIEAAIGRHPSTASAWRSAPAAAGWP